MTTEIWEQLPSVLSRAIRLDLHAFGSDAVRFKAYTGIQTLVVDTDLSQISSHLKYADQASEVDLLRASPSLQTLNFYYDSALPFSEPIELPSLVSLTITDSTAESFLSVLKAPSIATLRIARRSMMSRQQTIPFYLESAKMYLLPPSLTQLDIPNIGNLDAHILDRLPNTITSLNISTTQVPQFEGRTDKDSEATLVEHSPLPHEKEVLHPLKVNLFVDLSEITSSESLKEMMEIATRRGQEERSTASIHLNSNVTVAYYVMLPRTIEFYGKAAKIDGKVEDVLKFMEGVQKVYDSTIEVIIGLLPCTPLTSLPSMHVCIAPLFKDHPTEYLVQDALYASQKPVLSSQPEPSSHKVRLSAESFSRVKTCAVGGTFDYMHAGHRILLSACLLLANKKLIVGVTGEPLLVKKSNREYLQPFETRRRNVVQFCNIQRPDLFIDAVEILEPAGPTAVDPDIQMLVVSQETEAGIATLNKIREEKGFPAMEGLVVPLASSSSHLKELAPNDNKVSSTTIRIRQRKIDDDAKKTPA